LLARAVFFSFAAAAALVSRLSWVRLIAVLTSSRYSGRSTMIGRPGPSNSISSGPGLIDIAVGEADRRRAVGVAIELAVQLLGLGVELLGLLAQSQLGDFVRARGVQVGGEHLAVAGAGEGGVEHPARLARQALGGPRVAVIEVRDHGIQQLGRDGPDRAQLINGGQRDDAVADQLLGALRQLEDLDARGDALLGPPECLRGAVLAQAAVEHRTDGLGLLIGVELLARD